LVIFTGASLGVTGQEVWIKAWFDGDYNAIPGIGRQSLSDTETTHVQITRGRLTAIERVDGPPAGAPTLKQEFVAEAHLQIPDGQAWITPLQDLHLVDWESDSTASVLGGGGPRVGRVVGWAYAKIRDPRQTTQHKTIKPDQPLASDSASASMQSGGDSSTPGGSSETTAKAAPTDTQTPVPTPAVDFTTPPLPVHPCRVCSWGRALFLFLIVWIVCSVNWAFLAIAPLLIRCFLARFAVSILPANGNQRFIESSVLLLLGVGAFVYVVWRTLLGCGEVPTIGLIILFVLVPWSARIPYCWLIGLLGWMWGLAVLMSCPVQDGTCRTLDDLNETSKQAVEDTQNKISQIFRPDRDSEDVAGQSSSADGWIRTSIEEVEKKPEKFFTCTSKTDRKKEHYVIYMGESALFELNKAELNEASEPQLARIGKLLKKYPQSHLVVVGHADKSPHRDGPEGNLALSERRANAVVEWLHTGGFVKPEQIVAMGAGDRYPLFDTPGEFRGNRRVEVRVVCPGAKP
jgi:outer membrane protein OmpA-like peptidoglycan-associated protein